MPKEEGKKVINVKVPTSLYIMLKKMAIDNGITITYILVSYLRYLRKINYAKRRALDEHSRITFKVDVTGQGKFSKSYDDDQESADDIGL